MYSKCIETIPLISHEDMKYVRPYVTDFAKCRAASTREVSASLYGPYSLLLEICCSCAFRGAHTCGADRLGAAGFGFINGNPFLQRKKFGQTRHILHFSVGRSSSRFPL